MSGLRWRGPAESMRSIVRRLSQLNQRRGRVTTEKEDFASRAEIPIITKHSCVTGVGLKQCMHLPEMPHVLVTQIRLGRSAAMLYFLVCACSRRRHSRQRMVAA